jgi:hypothetical protein
MVRVILLVVAAIATAWANDLSSWIDLLLAW